MFYKRLDIAYSTHLQSNNVYHIEIVHSFKDGNN